MQKKLSIKSLKATVAVLSVSVIVSCNSNQFSTKLTPFTSEIDAVVCPQSFEVIMDFYGQVIAQPTKGIEQMDVDQFGQLMNADAVFQGVANSYLKTELHKMYLEFYQDIKYLSVYESNSDLSQLVSYIKVEDTENHLRKEIVDRYKSKISVISQDLQGMGYSCPSENDITRNPAGGDPKPNPVNPQIPLSDREWVTNELATSMKKVLAVTYQSCDVLKKKPLDKTDGNLKGVKEECCHDSGRGLLRHIDDLKLVQTTHPYLQTSYGSQCFNVSKNPLIYDFGGRPAFTRGSSGKLNFFSNWGGSEVLGYDCSAMAYTVIMGAGLRLKENKMLVASDVVAAQSRQFIDPESKGWSCLDSIEFAGDTKDALLPGDVASMDGHTFLIYRVGNDPFGIDNISDCKQVSSKNFDFDIIQSSPSKDGIGLNVYVGKDYLDTNSTMEKGMIEYARNYCERKKNSSQKVLKLDYFSLVRVSSKKSCRMATVQFENESCVQACIRTSTK